MVQVVSDPYVTPHQPFDEAIAYTKAGTIIIPTHGVSDLIPRLHYFNGDSLTKAVGMFPHLPNKRIVAIGANIHHVRNYPSGVIAVSFEYQNHNTIKGRHFRGESQLVGGCMGELVCE